jgi:hypothetical protein
MGTAMAATAAVILGFLAGLLTFQWKSRWCPVCGATFACPDAGCPATTEMRAGRRQV